jgi:nitroreductase
METDSVLQTIQARRTIRRFTDRDVSDDQIKTLLVAAMSAPSMFNRRPWQFVIIRDPATKGLVIDELRQNPGLRDAPAFIGVLGDPGRSPTWRLDLSGAIQNLLLVASDLGLGAAWINATDDAIADKGEAALRRRLQIPPHLELLAFVAVGYPAQERQPHEPDPHFYSTHVHYDSWDHRVVQK